MSFVNFCAFLWLILYSVLVMLPGQDWLPSPVSARSRATT